MRAIRVVPLERGYRYEGLVPVRHRFGITLRIQSDTSAAAGESGPNYGQATAFEYGTH